MNTQGLPPWPVPPAPSRFDEELPTVALSTRRWDTSSVFFPLIDNGDGNVKSNFMYSFIESIGSRPFHIVKIADSLVCRARNVAAAVFLKTDYQYLFFWDADIIAGSQHLDFMAENDHEILCGIYPKKQKELVPVLNCLPGTTSIETGGLVEIARGGTGFMRIHRSVLEAMKCRDIEYDNHGELQWDFFQVGVRNREYLSEDWYFCDRGREIGFKVMLDTRIQVKHEGSAVYPFEQKPTQSSAPS